MERWRVLRFERCPAQIFTFYLCWRADGLWYVHDQRVCTMQFLYCVNRHFLGKEVVMGGKHFSKVWCLMVAENMNAFSFTELRILKKPGRLIMLCSTRPLNLSSYIIYIIYYYHILLWFWEVHHYIASWLLEHRPNSWNYRTLPMFNRCACQ